LRYTITTYNCRISTSLKPPPAAGGAAAAELAAGAAEDEADADDDASWRATIPAGAAAARGARAKRPFMIVRTLGMMSN